MKCQGEYGWSSRRIIRNTILAFARRGWRKPREISVRKAGLRTSK